MLPVIQTYLRKDKLKDGKHPIVLIVYYQGKQRQVSTGLYIEETNFKKGKVTKHPNASWYNAMIKNKTAELEETYLKQAVDGSVSLGATKPRSNNSFFDYAIRVYEAMNKRCSPDYIYRAKAVIEDFKSFSGNLSFESINATILKNYEQHLFNRGISRNTINRMYKRIKQVYKEAVAHGLTSYNPFNTFKPVTFKQPKRNYLTMEDIKKIEDVFLLGPLDNTRNYFLIACYTGLRYCDLKKFNKEKAIIKNKGIERIIIGTVKTGEVVSIKLMDKVKILLTKINKPIISNIHTNLNLKIVAEIAGIQQNLTFHMARHSFAVNCASLGIPIEAVSKLLGHNSIRTTAIYYKLTDTKIDEYMDRWENA